MFKRATSPSRILFNCFDNMIIGKEEKILQENVTAYRDSIRKLLREKKKKIEENERNGKHTEFQDVLHLFLTNDFYANDEELIVDQCIGLLAAGTLPATALVVNLIVQSIQNPEVGRKIKEELQEKFFGPAGIKMGEDFG